MRLSKLLACACVAVVLPLAASAQVAIVDDWCDNFDSYTAGAGLIGQGNWTGWAPGGPDGTISTAQANSAPNSFRYNIGTDVVQYFGHTSGQFTASAMTYIASGSTGAGFFIMLNQYDPNGVNPNNWSVQVSFDSDSWLVETQWDGFLLDMIFDRWVEIRAEINLDIDEVALFYDNQPLGDPRLWTENSFSSGPGILEIQAIDLFSDTIDGMFMDDIVLVTAGNPCPTGGCVGDLDGDGDTDLADLGILLADFGCVAPGPCPGDLDGDGDTDLADLGILLADFGCTS